MKLKDSHCHLEEIDRNGRLDAELAAARKAGVTAWLSCALSPAEIIWHQQHQIEGVQWCAGIHPFYEPSRQLDILHIASLAQNHQIAAIGEIGFDKRNPDHQFQKNVLLMQLELAAQTDLPVVFHVVKAYYELYKLLKDNFPQVRGFLHGFNSSLEVFERFSEFDLAFSLNAHLPKEQIVRAIIKKANWQIETDAPYASPPGASSESNSLSNLLWVKNRLEKIAGYNLWI
jgi:TatD DNase family protein